MNPKILIELVKREISDISLLAANLDTEVSSFEVDLILAKLKNLADELNQLRPCSDIQGSAFHEKPKMVEFRIERQETIDSPILKKVPEENKAEVIVPDKQAEPEQLKVREETRQEVSIAEKNIHVKPVIEIIVPVAEVPIVVESSKTEDLIDLPEVTAIPVQPLVTKVAPRTKKVSPAKTVGDKFATDSKSLNDQFTGKIAEPDLAEKLSKSIVNDIRTIISLNEKLLFTRELFGSDGVKYNNTLDKIHASSSFNEASRIVNEMVVSDSDPETMDAFLAIVSRRF